MRHLLTLPALNGRVDPWTSPDGATYLHCPCCNHLTPDVPADALHPGVGAHTTSWIDCGCFTGTALPRSPRMRDCRCVLRYRATPARHGLYRIVEIDHETMMERHAVQAYLECLFPVPTVCR